MKKFSVLIPLVVLMGCANGPELHETFTVMSTNWEYLSVVVKYDDNTIKIIRSNRVPIALWAGQKFTVDYHYDGSFDNDYTFDRIEVVK